MSDLIQELKHKLVETLDLPDVNPEQIEDDAPLFGEGLGLDSIDVLEHAVNQPLEVPPGTRCSYRNMSAGIVAIHTGYKV